VAGLRKFLARQQGAAGCAAAVTFDAGSMLLGWEKELLTKDFVFVAQFE
jgi:hypothetical protein